MLKTYGTLMGSGLSAIFVAATLMACDVDSLSSEEQNLMEAHSYEKNYKEAEEIERKASEALFRETGLSLCNSIASDYKIETFAGVFDINKFNSSKSNPNIAKIQLELEEYRRVTSGIISRLPEGSYVSVKDKIARDFIETISSKRFWPYDDFKELFSKSQRTFRQSSLLCSPASRCAISLCAGEILGSYCAPGQCLMGLLGDCSCLVGMLESDCGCIAECLGGLLSEACKCIMTEMIPAICCGL